jgi:putative transposase
VKHWKSDDMVERWVAAGLLRAERSFRRIKAYRDLPSFIASLRGLVDQEVIAA